MDRKREFKQVSPIVLKALLSSILSSTEILIDILYEGNGNSSNVPLFQKMKPTASFISHDTSNIDNIYRLKLKPDDTFELEFQMEDYEGVERIYIHVFTEEQIKIIPQRLIPIMKEVLQSAQPRTILYKSLEENKLFD